MSADGTITLSVGSSYGHAQTFQISALALQSCPVLSTLPTGTSLPRTHAKAFRIVLQYLSDDRKEDPITSALHPERYRYETSTALLFAQTWSLAARLQLPHLQDRLIRVMDGVYRLLLCSTIIDAAPPSPSLSTSLLWPSPPPISYVQDKHIARAFRHLTKSVGPNSHAETFLIQFAKQLSEKHTLDVRMSLAVDERSRSATWDQTWASVPRHLLNGHDDRFLVCIQKHLPRYPPLEVERPHEAGRVSGNAAATSVLVDGFETVTAGVKMRCAVKFGRREDLCDDDSEPDEDIHICSEDSPPNQTSSSPPSSPERYPKSRSLPPRHGTSSSHHDLPSPQDDSSTTSQYSQPYSSSVSHHLRHPVPPDHVVQAFPRSSTNPTVPQPPYSQIYHLRYPHPDPEGSSYRPPSPYDHGTNSYIPATRPNDNVCRDNEEGDSYAPAPLPVFSPLNGSQPRKSYPVTRPIATNGNTPRPHPSPNTSTNSSPSAHHAPLPIQPRSDGKQEHPRTYVASRAPRYDYDDYHRNTPSPPPPEHPFQSPAQAQRPHLHVTDEYTSFQQRRSSVYSNPNSKSSSSSIHVHTAAADAQQERERGERRRARRRKSTHPRPVSPIDRHDYWRGDLGAHDGNGDRDGDKKCSRGKGRKMERKERVGEEVRCGAFGVFGVGVFCLFD